MESQEEDLTVFQRCLSEVLKSLSYDCGLSQKKLGKILHKLEKNHELDVNMIEDAGIKIIKFLSTLKGNIAMIIKTLDDGISEISEKQNEPLFEELSKELSIWKRSVVSINDNNEFTFTQVCDKGTMIGGSKFDEKCNPHDLLLPCTSTLDQERSEDSIICGDSISEDLSANQDASIQLVKDNVTFLNSNTSALIGETDLQNTSTLMDSKKCDQYGKDNTSDHCNDSYVSPITKNAPKTLEYIKQEIPNKQSVRESGIARESICLSLKTEPNLSDTQNTDDDWNDTLKQDNHKKSFGKVLDKVAKEEDNFDTETLQLNHDEIPDDDLFADFKIEPNDSSKLYDGRETVNITENTLLEQITQQCHTEQETIECRESLNDVTDDIQCKIAEDRRLCPNIGDETGIVSDSEKNVTDKIDSEYPREMLDKSDIVSSSALNENIHKDKSDSSCSECSEGKPIHKNNYDVDKISKVTVVNLKESTKRKDHDPIGSYDQIGETNTSNLVVDISSTESNIPKKKYPDSIKSNDQIENDIFSSNATKISSKESDIHKEGNQKLLISNDQLADTDLSDTISISSSESDIVINKNQEYTSSNHQCSQDITRISSIESGTHNKKMCDPISSNNQTEDTNSSDDDLYNALTQKIPKEMNCIDTPTKNIKKNDDNNISLIPTQIIQKGAKYVPSQEVMENTVSLVDFQNAEQTLNSKRNMLPICSVVEANIGSESRIEKSSNKMINGLDDSSKEKLEKMSESDNQCQNKASSSTSDSIISHADIVENPFSVETTFDSDEEMEKNGFLNEHSYSCTTTSDVEDPLRGPTEFQMNELGSDGNEINNGETSRNKDCMSETETCYIHSEHNYSLSDGESLENNEMAIANDYDSDVTDIDQVTKDLLAIPHSHNGAKGTKNTAFEDTIAERKDIPDSQSQESNNSYEFDVTENFNHLDSEENDTITQRSTSRNSQVIGERMQELELLSHLENNNLILLKLSTKNDEVLKIQYEWCSDSSCASSKKIDDSDDMVDALVNRNPTEDEISEQISLGYDSLSNDEMNTSLGKIDIEDELRKETSVDFGHNNVTNDEVNASLSKINSEDELHKEKSLDFDQNNVSDDEVNASLSKIDTEDELRKEKSLDVDQNNVSDDEVNASLSKIDTEDALRKEKNLDFDQNNVSDDEVNAYLSKIDTKDELRNERNLDSDQNNVSNDEKNASLSKIDTEDELREEKSLDIDQNNVSKDEVSPTPLEITTEGQGSKRNSLDDREVQQKDIEESTCIVNSTNMKEDIIKELENILNENLENTKTEEDHHIPKVEEAEQSDKENDVEDDECTIQIIEDNEQKDSENTITIENDNYSKEPLMDMIMEEILSDTEKARGLNNSEGTIILDCEDIKVESEEPDVQIIESNIDIGDEILSLLKEVESPAEDENKSAELDDAVKAENIMKIFQEYKSDESDSDITEDGSSSFSDSSLEIVGADQIAISENRFAQILKENNMVDCFVELEKLNLSANDIQIHQKYLEDNWEWLCDLTNLQNKRKYSSPAPFQQAKRSGKKRRSESFELGDSASSSSSDVEISGYRSGTPVLPQDLQNKIDDILANTICKELRNDGKSSSASSDDSDDSMSKKKKIKEKNEKLDDAANNGRSDDDTMDEDASKNVLSKEELKKKAWKNDPLLKGRLLSNSESDDSKTSNSKKRRKKRRYEHTEISIDSDKFDSDSDTDVLKNNKSKLEENEISPIKRNIPVSDDSDSDIEFVPQKLKTPIKSDDELGPSQKGRRNIRALITEETLAEATKKANKEELERIERLKEREKVIETFSQSFSMSHSEEQVENPLFLDVDDRTGEQIIQVHNKITAKLKDHQRQGIQFMWDSCYESVERLKKHDGSGCILAHCMGLGKTFQVLALIHTLFSHEVTNTKHVLVVCPLSTVSNWKKEVKWAFKDIPEDKMFSVFTIGTRKETSNKYEIVKKWQLRKKGLLVLGYEGFENLTNEAKLEKISPDYKNLMLESLIDPGPDLVICDEGHLLRNKKALKSKALNKIRTKRRIVLTGTPLQNNLNEYYHMVQIVKPNLLGNSKEFKTNFVNPITNGQYEDSTEDDIRLMMTRTHVLHRLLGKTVQRVEDSELELYLPKMVDHAVFIQLTQSQIDLYNHFSELMKHNKDNKNTHSFLVDFKIFQYICTHPHLLAVMDNLNKKKIKERDLITNEDDPAVCITKDWWKGRLPQDCDKKIEYGTKLVVMKSIIEECEEIDDKVLVFSQSLGELDLIEHFLKTNGTRKCACWQKKLDYYRMDGTVSPEDRTFICDKFNNPENPRMRLLLMSTKVGGLGLNLTAANRVIIMTVNWNPSYDTQSVFRVYRFGQQKAVYVYRLISLDTMEEKVYQRGVTKLAIAHRVVDKHQITNHYQRMHLQELYTCKPNADNERPTPNVPEDQLLAKLILRLPYIFKYHEHKALLANRPEINLSKEELSSAWQAWKDRENAPKPAPPPPKALVPTVPQKPIQTGPDFNNAYNLSRNNLNIIANLNRTSLLAPTAEQMKHYLQTITKPNGVYHPSIKNVQNPNSNQHIPNGGPLNLTNKDHLRLPVPNNQADKFSNRMWSYIPDQTKNIRLPAPTINRGQVANETIVSAAPSISKDGLVTVEMGYPTVSIPVRSSDANNVSRGFMKRIEPVVTDKVKPYSMVTKNVSSIPTSMANGNRLQQNMPIPVAAGTWNMRVAENPKANTNAVSDSSSEMRFVEVRKPQHSSPKPKITMVPKLVTSKIGKNPINIPRMNPRNSLLLSPNGVIKANKKIPNKNTGPILTNRVVTVNTSNQNRPSASMPSESISNTRIAKRKLDYSVDGMDRVKRTLLTLNANKGNLTSGESKEKMVIPKVTQNTINQPGKRDAAPQTSESVSLSNNLLRSLGQSGVTIRKVSDEKDVIMLD